MHLLYKVSDLQELGKPCAEVQRRLAYLVYLQWYDEEHRHLQFKMRYAFYWVIESLIFEIGWDRSCQFEKDVLRKAYDSISVPDSITRQTEKMASRLGYKSPLETQLQALRTATTLAQQQKTPQYVKPNPVNKLEEGKAVVRPYVPPHERDLENGKDIYCDYCPLTDNTGKHTTGQHCKQALPLARPCKKCKHTGHTHNGAYRDDCPVAGCDCVCITEGWKVTDEVFEKAMGRRRHKN